MRSFEGKGRNSDRRVTEVSARRGKKKIRRGKVGEGKRPITERSPIGQVNNEVQEKNTGRSVKYEGKHTKETERERKTPARPERWRMRQAKTNKERIILRGITQALGLKRQT